MRLARGGSRPSLGPVPEFFVIKQFRELVFLDAWTLARRGDAAAAGVSEDEAPAAIAAAELRNPYTDEPFGWLPDERAVVFVGQSRLAYGRVALRY